jgi:hypothetical protein
MFLHMIEVEDNMPPVERPAAPAASLRLVQVETAASVLWFVMDGCWMMGLATAARALALPALATQLYAFRYTERALEALAVTASVNCWLLMNVFWMFADLGGEPALLAAARVAFGAGVLLLAMAAARERSAAGLLERALTRFRRLRVPTR